VKEKVQSLVLILLVLSSLYLTYLLWYARVPYEVATQEEYERVYFEEPRPAGRVIAPEKIVFPGQRTNRVLKEGQPGFQEVWGKILEQLEKGVLKGGIVSENRLPRGSLLLQLHFEPPFPIGSGTTAMPERPYRELAGLEIWERGELLELVLKAVEGGEERGLFLEEGGAQQLQELLEKLSPDSMLPYREFQGEELTALVDFPIQVEEPLWIPLLESVPALEIAVEEPENERLVKIFFTRYNLVRRIDERDGATIYTDGERGLRIGRERLEYSAPLLEHSFSATDSYPAALNQANRLLCYYSGWPAGLRLVGLDLVSGEGGRNSLCRCQWRFYAGGLPLLYGENGWTVEMAFNDGGLIYLNRHLFQPRKAAEEEIVVAPFSQALKKAFKEYQEQGAEEEGPAYLEAVELAYLVDFADSAYRGQPVWVVRINGREMILDGKSLHLLEGGAR